MEIINKVQREILGLFTSLPDGEKFYLSRGTALSYFYLKHRKSYDLDFFTAEEEIIVPFSFNLEQKIKGKGLDVKRQRGMHSFVELLVRGAEDETVIHLGCETPFRLQALKEFCEFPGLKVDSLLDISANKLLALFGRATLRDFIDVFFLLTKAVITKEELLKKAKLKDPGFDIYWLGVALERINSFDKENPEMLLLLEKVDFNDLVKFFNCWRKEIAKDLI